MWGRKNTALVLDGATDLSIDVKTDIREDPPQFKRVYTAALGIRHIELSIEARTSTFGGRSYWGNLKQSDGASVYFDPHRPAEKIIDREIISSVLLLCDEILRADKNYYYSRPDVFTDRNGDIWKRIAG